LGWLCGSEGKVPKFYRENCWIVPPEALHDIKKLPGKEQLQVTPQYEGHESPDLSDQPTDAD